MVVSHSVQEHKCKQRKVYFIAIRILRKKPPPNVQKFFLTNRIVGHSAYIQQPIIDQTHI